MLKIASASEVTFYLSCVFYTRYPPKSKKKKKQQNNQQTFMIKAAVAAYHTTSERVWLGYGNRTGCGSGICVCCVCVGLSVHARRSCAESVGPRSGGAFTISILCMACCVECMYGSAGRPIYIYACASAKRKSSFSLPSKVLINGRAGGILYSTPMIDRVDWNRSQRVRPTQWRNVAAKLESQHNAKLLLSRCCCRFIVVVWKLHYVIDN